MSKKIGFKVVFVGGGSYRTLPIVRAVMKDKEIFDGGEICLVDFNIPRVETVGRMIMKTPEYQGSNCKVTWTDKLEKALPGADMVSVSFPVGSFKMCALSDQASLKRGFVGGDQISLSGAFRSLTGGRILWDIAKKMEKHCPDAWLVDFANPVAVYSGMINNHTKVRAMGICAGFANHRWDLNRMIFEKDECSGDFKVASAGINHLSFIVRGEHKGKELYKLIDQKIINNKKWKPCKITSFPASEPNVHFAIAKLVEMHKRFRSLIFSTEFDGMTHLFFEEMLERLLKKHKNQTEAQLDKAWKAGVEARKKMDAEFAAHLDKKLDKKFWQDNYVKNAHFGENPTDPTVIIIRALSGVSKEWLAASFPNRGAVRGFKDRTVLEYSMTLDKNGIKPDPNLEVPDCFHGLISSLATHQTLLGDAIAAKDPQIFAQALFAYPIYQDTSRARGLWRDLLKIHEKEIDPVFQKAADYF